MSAIDNRIVQMNFNNDEFEKRVSKTKTSIENLDDSLNELGKNYNSKPFQNSLNSIGDALDGVGEKFSVLEQVMTGFFFNMGQQLENFALNLVESFTIDPLIAGYQKYENKIMQTAGLINTAKFQGYDEEDVDKVLEQLQWYADATSFDTTSMQEALQSLLNSNVDLYDAVNLIMGIGNSITYAGQSATKSSQAFTWWARAVSSSNGMQQLWYKSLTTMGVITPELNQTLIETGERLGYLKKVGEDVWETTSQAAKSGIEVTLESLQDSLSYGKWMQGDVISEVFSGKYGSFANELYQFMEAAEETGEAFVTVDEAIEAMNKLAAETGTEVDEFGQLALISATQAKVWSEVVDAVKDAVSSNYVRMYTAIFGTYQEAKVTMTELNNYLADVFGGMSGSLADFFEAWKEQEGRSNIIQGVKNLVNVIETLIAPINEAKKAVFGIAKTNWLADLSRDFKEFTEKLIVSENTAKVIKSVSELIFKIVKGIVGVIKIAYSFVSTITSAFGEVVNSAIDVAAKIIDFTNIFFGVISKLEIFENISERLSWVWTNLKTKFSLWVEDMGILSGILGPIVSAFETFGDSMSDVIGDSGELSEHINELTSAISETVNSYFANFGDRVKEAYETVKNYVELAITSVAGFFVNIASDLKTTFEIIWSIVQSSVEKITTGLSDLTVKLFSTTGEVADKELSQLELYRAKIVGKQSLFDTIIDKIKSIIEVLGDVLKLDLLRQVIGVIKKFKAIPQTISEISGTLSQLTDSLKTMQKSVKANIIKKIAVAVLLLAAAVFVISMVDPTKLGDAMMSVVEIMIGVVGSLYLLSKMDAKQMSNISKVLIGFGAAVVLIATAISMLAKLPPEARIGEATLAILAVMVMIEVMVAIMSENGSKIGEMSNSKDVGVMLLKMASGMLIIAKAIEIMAEIPSDRLWPAVGAMAVIMLALVAFVTVLATIQSLLVNANFGTIAKMGTLFVTLAASLIFIAGALAIIAAIDSTKLEGAVNAITAVLFYMTLLVGIGSLNKTMLQFGAGILLMAAGLLVMAGALYALASLGDNATAGLRVFEEIMLVLSLSSILIKSSGKDMLLLSAAMIVMSFGLMTLVAAFKVISLIDLPSFIEGFTYFALIMAALVIAGNAFEAGAGAGLMQLAIAMTLIAIALKLFVAIFNSIDFTVIGAKLHELTAGIIAWLVEDSEMLIEGIFYLFDICVEAIAKCVVDLIVNLGEMIGEICQYLYNALGGEGEVTTMEALSYIFGGIWDWLVKEIPVVWNKLKTWFLSITKMISTWLLSKKLEFVHNMKTIGKDLVEGLKEGIKNAAQGAVNTVLGLGKSVIEGLRQAFDTHSPSKKFEEIGEYCVEGLTLGLKDKTNEAPDAAEELANKTLNTFAEAFTTAYDAIEGDLNDEVTITPVLDFSEIQNEKGTLSSLLSDTGLTAKVNGVITPTNYGSSINDSINGLRGDMLNASTSGLSADDVISCLKDALSGMGVYMDRSKVGSLVTRYQSNVKLASGR